MPPIDISDLRATIIPKSDQLNAEQLLGGPMTITVSDVSVGGGEDQPVTVHYHGDAGRPFKPCKTMRKLLIMAWGQDGREWIGKAMTLYNDQAVRFGGMDVGGIRISHLSHIKGQIKASLTATKGKKAQFVVDALEVVALEDVLHAIATANGRSGMARAKELAAGLSVDADIEEARKAYAAKAEALKAEAKPT